MLSTVHGRVLTQAVILRARLARVISAAKRAPGFAEGHPARQRADFEETFGHQVFGGDSAFLAIEPHGRSQVVHGDLSVGIVAGPGVEVFKKLSAGRAQIDGGHLSS